MIKFFEKFRKKEETAENANENTAVSSDERNLEMQIIEGIAKDANPEKAVITYILLESERDNISLANKGDTTYISFRNPYIKEFLKEWYSLLQLHQHNRLSKSTYEMFIKNKLNENNIINEDEILTGNIEAYNPLKKGE